jgi:hypothetical protein
MRMRTLCAVAVAFLQGGSLVAQTPAESFSSLRAQVIQTLEGRHNIRVVNAARVRLPERHDLDLTFSTSSTDIFLAESTNEPNGRVMTVFHTDLTLALRAAASGADVNTLQIVSASDDSVASQFQRLLATSDQHLLSMLERRRQNVPRQ